MTPFGVQYQNFSYPRFQ